MSVSNAFLQLLFGEMMVQLQGSEMPFSDKKMGIGPDSLTALFLSKGSSNRANVVLDSCFYQNVHKTSSDVDQTLTLDDLFDCFAILTARRDFCLWVCNLNLPFI